MDKLAEFFCNFAAYNKIMVSLCFGKNLKI